MKYIKRFSQHTDYLIYELSEDFIRPNVSLCVQERDIHIHYNPKLHDYSQDYLTFTALEDGTFTFLRNSLQYSLDNGTTWTTLAANTASPTVTTGSKIMWKQTGLVPDSLTVDSELGIGTFTSTGNFDVSGNIMSLYYGDNFVNLIDLTGKSCAFANLFSDCVKLVHAEHLILSSTTLSVQCYQYMFNGCTSMTTVPELPATSLADYCYGSMFQGCTSLTTAPELPATLLVSSCYSSMFYHCINLNYIKCLATDISASGCTQGWVSNVASSGTFVKNSAATWNVSGTSGIPSGWTIETASE